MASRSFPRALGQVLVLALAIVPIACGASMKNLDFNVTENGQSVPVKKMYNDGFGGTEATKAFEAVQRGDMPAAIQILEADIARHPTFAWNYYDLGIVYEATGDWNKAEIEMKEALRVEGPKGVATKTYSDELVFIAAHKPK